MKINDKKIVVCCSQGITGGPELLHQLVHELREIGRDAHIAYYPFDEPFSCPEPYRKYNAPQGTLIDEPDTFVLVPESATFIIKQIKKASAGVWWMSVDNYLLAKHQSKLKDLYRRYKSLIRIRLPLFRMNQLAHFSQSHYSEEFLRQAHLNATPLTDYLSEVHLKHQDNDRLDNKENIVAYNPMKGQKQTLALINAYPDIQFVPIQKMTSKQVSELLSRSKIYVDFGHHPGKDRPPREAAMAGCCVITGRKGSAKYHQDVAIPDKYKLDDSRKDYIKHFGELVYKIFNAFETHAKDFDDYRAKIRLEPEIFKKQVREIFG